MAKQFIDAETRSAYITGLSGILCMIFEISDPERKQAITLELEMLDDDTLIERQKYVEEYFEKEEYLRNSYMNKVQILEHTLEEDEEKEVLGGVHNFTY